MPCVRKKKDDSSKYSYNDKSYEEKFRELYPPEILFDIDGIPDIIEQNHYDDFKYKLSDSLDNYCDETFDYPNFHPRNIAKKQVDILDIMYNNCVKNYDFEYIYYNPQIAENFIKKDLEKYNNKSKKHNVPKEIHIKNKKYDWSSKSYK